MTCISCRIIVLCLALSRSETHQLSIVFKPHPVRGQQLGKLAKENAARIHTYYIHSIAERGQVRVSPFLAPPSHHTLVASGINNRPNQHMVCPSLPRGLLYYCRIQPQSETSSCRTGPSLKPNESVETEVLLKKQICQIPRLDWPSDRVNGRGRSRHRPTLPKRQNHVSWRGPHSWVAAVQNMGRRATLGHSLASTSQPAS